MNVLATGPSQAEPGSGASTVEKLLTWMARTRALPVWARFGSATLLVLAATAARIVLFGWGPGSPYLTFLPAVVLAAALFDRGAGYWAVALSVTLGDWLFMEPFGSLHITRPEDTTAALLFFGSALLTAFLVQELHLALSQMIEQRDRAVEKGQQLAHANAELSLALRETVHRIGNDLQTLAATLRLQANATSEAAAREALREAEGRTRALARLNARLTPLHGEQSALDSRAFLSEVASDLKEALVGLRPIAVEVAAEARDLPRARAVQVGLIANELVTNALKYAFPDDRAGTVCIRFWREDEEFVLAVEDDGIGLPDADAVPKGSGLGRRLVRALAAQLGGRLGTWPPADGGPGTVCEVRFPVEAGPAARPLLPSV